MLTALPGGRENGRDASAADALREFARLCAERKDDPLAASIVIDVLGSFLAQVVVARGGASAPPHECEALASVRAQVLIRALGPCLLLFPYQGVVGSGIVEALPRQAWALARWLAREGFADEYERVRFESLARRAEPEGALHHDLQARLDALFEPLPRANRVERVVGRFMVARADDFELLLDVPPTDTRYRIVLPAGLPVSFEPGQAVSMALQESPIGWIPLASSLPIRPEALDGLFEEALSRAPAERWSRDGAGPKDSRAGPRSL